MFAEVLTGIALVQKSVSFIKESINTAKDASEIVSAVEDLLDGEQQVGKDRARKDGVSIKDQLGIKGVAHEVINSKLAAEHRYQMGVLIDQRFGHGTFKSIVDLRAKRIQEAKEQARLLANVKQKKLDETMEVIGVLAVVLGLAIVVVTAIVFYANALTNQYVYSR